MILNIRVRCILILGDGPYIAMSRGNGDNILTPCTLETIPGDGLQCAWGQNVVTVLPAHGYVCVSPSTGEMLWVFSSKSSTNHF